MGKFCSHGDSEAIALIVLSGGENMKRLKNTFRLLMLIFVSVLLSISPLLFYNLLKAYDNSGIQNDVNFIQGQEKLAGVIGLLLLIISVVGIIYLVKQKRNMK